MDMDFDQIGDMRRLCPAQEDITLVCPTTLCQLQPYISFQRYLLHRALALDATQNHAMCDLHTLRVASASRRQHDACQMVRLMVDSWESKIHMGVDARSVDCFLNISCPVHIDRCVFELREQMEQFGACDDQGLVVCLSNVIDVFRMILCITFEWQRNPNSVLAMLLVLL
jgi:hypothetical protein